MYASPVETLRQAIVHDPWDDMAWLALADSLEELGDTGRAELVRLREWLRRGQEGAERRRKEARLQYLLKQGVAPLVPRRTIQLAGRVGLEMVLLPPGSFRMGSPSDEPGRMSDEGPRHSVVLTRPLWLGVCPVTQGQWQAVMGSNPSRFWGEYRPVEQISLADCLAFCAVLNRGGDHRFRLPTEAEWEYACRAGTSSAYHYGSTITGELASLDGLWGEETTAVRQFPPNAWGLYDMHGNVWEWCGDRKRWYGQGEVIDPHQTESGVPVARGGAWVSEPWLCRSACRWGDPGRSHGWLGFRLALEWERPDEEL